MSEPTTTTKRRIPRWVFVGAGVLAAGALALALRPGAAPAPEPQPTATGPVTGDEYRAPGAPVGGYKIEAGAPADDVAVDGLTPIGYPEDCTGAVTAATNYYTGVTEALYQDRLTGEEFDALLDQINAGLDPGDGTGPMTDLKEQFDAIRAEDTTSGIPWQDIRLHPEWGAFRVASCTDEGAAVVDIVGFFEWDAAPGFSGQYPRQITVSWFDGDWRLRAVQELNEDPAAVIGPDSVAPLPATDRRALLEAGGPAWMEYTNAPR